MIILWIFELEIKPPPTYITSTVIIINYYCVYGIGQCGSTVHHCRLSLHGKERYAYSGCEIYKVPHNVLAPIDCRPTIFASRNIVN